MEIATLVSVLDHPHQAAGHLHAWGLRDPHRGQQILLELADCGLTLDLLATVCEQLGEHLPPLADPDAALDALRRYLFASRSPLALGALLARDDSALPMLLRVFSLGPRWRDLLIADPEAFDLLRLTDGQPLSRDELLAETLAEIAAISDDRSLAAALRRVRQRQTLRIAYGDLVGRQKVELATEQLTNLAEAIVAAALSAAQRKAADNSGSSSSRSDSPPPLAVVALGRLGAAEMDYGDAIELLLVQDPPPAATDAARRAAYEHAERVARQMLRYLAGTAAHDATYSVRLVSLPDSASPALVHTADDTVLGLDSFGRTWHRQELLRARPIAGDRQLAADVLRRLAPWVFRRYLNRADETGIKALRRRILRRAARADADRLDVASSRGGLADIEAVVQFLQLHFGEDRPVARQPGTLAAIAGLELAGVLSVEERTLLESSYLWLRQLLHRLQVLVDPGQSTPPSDEQTPAHLAGSLGLATGDGDLPAECQSRQARVWLVLSRLLGTALTEEPPPAVVELLLDPAPTPAEAAEALSGYGLADPQAAALALHSLAVERTPFLSTRRCRHHLSLIVQRLLAAIAATPDPDATLSNLCTVSESLGAKGVLWELMGFHPPSLLLYVRLCAASPYLSGILTANPGMIDDLVDSLQLDKLPTREELEALLTELSRGSPDPLPILHDLKNASHLRIGVRDILGQDAIEATHRSLADVAEFCLAHLVEREYAALTAKFGQPTLGPGPLEVHPCRLAVLGLGKLGGREPNYHSNVEVAFLYEGDGTTRPAPRSRQERTTNGHFFTQLAQRVLKQASQLTPQGRLYNVEVVLRPIGVGGAIALPLADFANHFLAGQAPLWQWQALCQARVVCGEAAAGRAAATLVRQLLTSRLWQGSEPTALLQSRQALERGAAELNLKRGRGGTLDIEWLVQLLQLRHAATAPAVLVPGTQDALAALASAGCLDRDDAEYFAESYRLLRRIESGLRLLNTSARHDLPDSPLELSKLALLLGQPTGDTLRDRTIMTLAENRRRFERIVTGF